MRLRFVVLAAVLGALAVQPFPAPAAPTALPKLKLCGQITNGPYDAWSGYLKNGKHVTLTGKTWTVAAIPGSVCPFAMKATPALLKQWARHSLRHSSTTALKGWLCGPVPENSPGQDRGGACDAYKPPLRLFSFRMFGQLTIAQIKQELGIK